MGFNIYLLERLRTSVFDEGHHVVAKHDKRKLTTVIELIKRIKEDDYLSDEAIKLMKDRGVFDNFDNINNVSFRDNMQKIHKRADILREQDISLLIKLIKTQSRKWWD
jgi:hypothetical protein